MNEIAIELGQTLSFKQKCLLRDLCLLVIENNDVDFDVLEPIFEAIQHERFYNKTYNLSVAKTILDKKKDGILP